MTVCHSMSVLFGLIGNVYLLAIEQYALSIARFTLLLFTVYINTATTSTIYFQIKGNFVNFCTYIFYYTRLI